MVAEVEVQLALDESSLITLPDNEQIQQWVNKAVDVSDHEEVNELQLVVRIVEEAEISQLNADYRHKDGATNVLSFPFVLPSGVPAGEVMASLGDLVVCASVVENEAQQQNKEVLAHWAHMIVHGTLHLLGYDHQTEQEAFEMEALEARILIELGYSNPYE